MFPCTGTCISCQHARSTLYSICNHFCGFSGRIGEWSMRRQCDSIVYRSINISWKAGQFYCTTQHEMRNVLAFLLLIGSLSSVRCEVFTALIHMKHLLGLEKDLLYQLNSYIAAEKARYDISV